MSKDIVLSNLRLIDGIADQPRERVSIVIRDDRIAEIIDGEGPSGPDVETIDCQGKTAMPGMIDTHVHATLVDDIDLSLFIATGVTTARDVGGKLDKVLTLRDRLNKQEVLGPRLFVCGPLMDGGHKSFPKGELAEILDTVPTAADAPAKMKTLLDAGVDGIKLYFGMTPDILGACIDAVEKRVPVTGHIGATTALEATELGINGLEHMWISPYNNICPVEMRFGSEMSMMSSRFSKVTFEGWENADLQGPGAQNLFDAMADKQVKMGTTLDLLWLANIGLAAALQDEDRIYIPASGLKHQRALAKIVNAGEEWDIHTGFPPGNGKQALEKQKEAVRILHEKGGVIVGGTDCCGIAYPPPGFALLREAELLADAIGDMAALKAITASAATALGKEDELGTIAPGRYADILLLGKDPSQDVRNLRSLERVYQGGVAHDPEGLLAAYPARDFNNLGMAS
jgi:imidazolonepropionase-like amidohydrolase